VGTALEALQSEAVEEQIIDLIDEVEDDATINLDDEIENALRESTPGPPARLLKPEAVTFDFGGTILQLVEFDKVAGVRRMLDICEISNNRTEQDVLEFIDELDLQIQERREESLIEYPSIQRQRLIYNALGIIFDLPPHEIELEFWKASMQYTVEEGITTVLDGLNARDIRIALLSNSAFSATTMRYELQRHGLHDYFSDIVVSADYGFRKPHPLIYRSALSILGADPAHTWHVGNSRYYDVEGAIIAGMGAVWYNPSGRQPQGLAPHETVNSWIGFQNMVERVFNESE
jgi:putative hydrolase of the HAD superfamily